MIFLFHFTKNTIFFILFCRILNTLGFAIASCRISLYLFNCYLTRYFFSCSNFSSYFLIFLLRLWRCLVSCATVCGSLHSSQLHLEELLGLQKPKHSSCIKELALMDCASFHLMLSQHFRIGSWILSQNRDSLVLQSRHRIIAFACTPSVYWWVHHLSFTLSFFLFFN